MMKDYLLKRTAVMAIILGALCACQPVMALADDMPEEEESYVVMDEGGDLEAAESRNSLPDPTAMMTMML